MCMRMNIAVPLDKIQDAFMRLERAVSHQSKTKPLAEQ